MQPARFLLGIVVEGNPVSRGFGGEPEARWVVCLLWVDLLDGGLEGGVLHGTRGDSAPSTARYAAPAWVLSDSRHDRGLRLAWGGWLSTRWIDRGQPVGRPQSEIKHHQRQAALLRFVVGETRLAGPRVGCAYLRAGGEGQAETGQTGQTTSVLDWQTGTWQDWTGRATMYLRIWPVRTVLVTQLKAVVDWQRQAGATGGERACSAAASLSHDLERARLTRQIRHALP